MNSPQVIDDRYRLVRPVGAGGMGRVWQGLDLHLEREVAVKVVRPDLLDGPGRHEAAARFRREARVTAQIQHPGVPAIFDAGLDAASGELFLVMAYLPGLNLRDLLDETGPLPVDWTLAIGAQLASVLTAAHERHVIHRDLKPANIIVGPTGLVHVVDFGIAAVLEPDVSRLTATGDKPGTLNYMAPEQIRAQPAGPAADLYALGALLFEMATGERLFADRGSAYEVQTAHLKELPEPVRRARPDFPSELDGLVSRLLSKEPAERGSDAAAVHLQLAAMLAGSPASGTPVRDCGDPTWPFRAPLAPARVAREAAAKAAAPQPDRSARRLAEADRAYAAGDFNGALSAFRALAKDLETPDPALALRCQAKAAQCLAALGNAASALTGLSSVVERQRRLEGERARSTLYSRRIAVDMLAALGRMPEAHRELATVVGEMAAAFGPADADTIEAERLLRAWSAPPQAGPGWPMPTASSPGSPPR
ncbi:serine/threonine-protein kinase [Glycomyces paridis]|uniref:non-specific serine/threonine protein kinase n=1 Tax=Glycomyces paridis TaxID=2126555 RepID=A0A4S8PB73_9ACTN|nr:serine/threonine-protein kinase [Glycomyces paridis]THV27553.1 serine/threonine protein kinase [Glycomyces paridis]